MFAVVTSAVFLILYNCVFYICILFCDTIGIMLLSLLLHGIIILFLLLLLYYIIISIILYSFLSSGTE